MVILPQAVRDKTGHILIRNLLGDLLQLIFSSFPARGPDHAAHPRLQADGRADGDPDQRGRRSQPGL